MLVRETEKPFRAAVDPERIERESQGSVKEAVTAKCGAVREAAGLDGAENAMG